ncbi:UDP-glucose dehydrogenase [Only Syngen Nebraska virus 5]|uniref:UDP-glucose dehydrogenase n=1 Tax=Only Syngen Nebraska virus 5 TaxID=1917232 RepID=UPI000900FE0C|nr:UDP-glucose dehydrogenase [Only Syngen Nebraska virus 5]APC25831.1 UDP-glucose dehydrogenase [Only Syngen Nebraska virus 5]
MSRITVVGCGYVGTACAVLLAQNNEVTILDISEERVQLIKNKKSPIEDKEIEEFLETKDLKLTATTDKVTAYKNAEFVIIATPTDYDVVTRHFNTKTVEKVIEDVIKNTKSEPTIVIKSTIPIGFVDKAREQFDYKNIIFSPEFLREGRALYDNLYPSRIIVGDESPSALKFANLLIEGSKTPQVPVLTMGTREAEGVKLFSNTYLAMRVAYFNELDTFAMSHNMNAKEIIDGVTLEPRIGQGYCNPSFGYGAYCFPKDTKQLLANFEGVPQDIVSAIVESNETRKEALVSEVENRFPTTVGVYKLAAKAGSDNFRSSAIVDVMKKLANKGYCIKIFEPAVEEFENYEVDNDLTNFAKESDVIIANRVPVDHRILFGKKLVTRDIYGDN